MYVALKHACKGIGMYKLSKKMKKNQNKYHTLRSVLKSNKNKL